MLVIITSAISAVADEGTAGPDLQSPTENAVAAAEISTLLKQLNSPGFAERQQATAALLGLDVDSAPTLNALRKNLNPETRQRLAAILQRLHRRWFDRKLQQLQQTDGEEVAATFPDWHAFQQSTAEPDEALMIFQELIQAEQELFTCRLFDPERVPLVLETRAKVLESHCNGSDSEQFPVTQAAALMLIASNEEVQLLRGTSYYISRCFDDERFSQLLRTGKYSGELQQLCTRWILRPRIAPDRPLLFAMQHQLPAGRDLALRVLSERRRGPRVFHAAMALSVLGDKQDLPFLESLFADNTVIWPPAGNTGTESDTSSLRLQVRDAALLAACHLRGIAPGEIGLSPEPAPETLYQINTVGFATDDAREQSVQQYQNLLQDRDQ